jgi:hypothetical protein
MFADEEGELKLNEDKYNEFLSIFEAASKDTPPYAGDLENEVYKGIVQKLRDFNPEDHVQKETEEAAAE